MVKIVTSFAIVIGHLVDLTYQAAEISAHRHIVLAVYQDSSFHFLTYFYAV